ncbi:hypothetical protein H9Q13_07985 [Pontibacter sp. JH31]|uniref:DUF4268 domain-containing protein n=1 Tax=Pontibacter aquaedesilientis TaxID=2766980 RepID=A0ABR7XFM6_9BACT|nr:hypothetical protein [Pontibacter aquaedesilientis]MBD1397102.1 hypothetical protein [Pontibacter aquaedesilientis]
MQDRPLRDKKALQQLYNTVLPELAKHIHQHLADVIALFHDFRLERLLDTWTREPGTDAKAEISIEQGNIQQMGLRLRLEGFERVGADNFDLTKDLLFKLERNFYTVGPDKENNWLEMDYLQHWDNAAYEMVAEKWVEQLIDDLTQKLENLAT